MFYTEKDGKVLLRVRVTPNASVCKVCGVFADADGTEYLKISLTAVPEKGRANKALIAFLSEVLRLPKAAFEIVGGETDRYKSLEISGEAAMIIHHLDEIVR